MELGDFKGAVKYMDSHPDGYEYSSTGTCWNYSRALCDYILNPKKRNKLDEDYFRQNPMHPIPNAANMLKGKEKKNV